MKMFFSVAANQGFVLSSMDIRAAFLQDKCLDREVFLEPPKGVRKDVKLWRLRKPLYSLNDASCKFANIGLQRLEGDEASYYKHGKNRELERIVSTHVDDFILAGNPEFINMMTKHI